MTALFSQGSYFTRDSGAVAISVIAGKLVAWVLAA
jgi:hypothetical protein